MSRAKRGASDYRQHSQPLDTHNRQVARLRACLRETQRYREQALRDGQTAKGERLAEYMRWLTDELRREEASHA